MVSRHIVLGSDITTKIRIGMLYAIANIYVCIIVSNVTNESFIRPNRTVNSRYNEVLGTCKFLRYIRIFVISG